MTRPCVVAVAYCTVYLEHARVYGSSCKILLLLLYSAPDTALSALDAMLVRGVGLDIHGGIGFWRYKPHGMLQQDPYDEYGLNLSV